MLPGVWCQTTIQLDIPGNPSLVTKFCLCSAGNKWFFVILRSSDLHEFQWGDRILLVLLGQILEANPRIHESTDPRTTWQGLDPPD